MSHDKHYVTNCISHTHSCGSRSIKEIFPHSCYRCGSWWDFHIQDPGISTAAGGLEIGNINVTRGDFNDPEMSGIKPTDPSETDGEALGSTDVNKYVEVCKCNRAKSFTCNTETLFTITKSELFVCIRSKSPDVKVDFLEKMVSDFAGSGSACCFLHVPGIVSLTYQFLLFLFKVHITSRRNPRYR